MIRVCIADDQRLMRDGLKTLLSLEPDMDVTAVAANGLEAVECARNEPVDVMLMDIRMPTMNGIEAVQKIRQEHPDIRILMLTTFDDHDDVVGALSAGAAGYLLKDMPADEIAAAIRTAHQGGGVLPPQIAGTLLHHVQTTGRQDYSKDLSASPASSVSGEVHRAAAGLQNQWLRVPEPSTSKPELTEELTEREREVLNCLAEGLSNREIASRLFLTEGTVKNHVSNLIAKLALRDRTQVALFAVRHGYGQMLPD